MDHANAERRLTEWTRGAYALALLDAARASGLLAELHTATHPRDAARRVGTDPEQATRVLMALEALGVVASGDDGYRLSDGWSTLTATDAPLALGDRLGVVDPIRTALAACFDSPPGFDAVAEGEAVALARSVWGVPTSPAALEAWADLDAEMPEVRAVWERGGRHAEFGCGAGRDLVRVAAMYPDVRVVGYDVIPAVAEQATDLAAEAGVGDRVDVRIEDILELDVHDAFDVIVWSQMFFPPALRPGAIASIARALVPGGYLVMQLMGDLPDPEDVEPSDELATRLLFSVAYARWKLQWQRSDDVRSELEGYGFEHVRTVPHPRTTFLVMRLPDATRSDSDARGG